MDRSRTKWLLLPFLVATLTLTSCLDLSLTENNYSNESVNDLQIVKAGLYNTNMVEYHEYICSDDTNQLYAAGPIDDGLIAITISDDQDSIVFNKKLTGFTTFNEPVIGVSGIWTVKLDYKDARGTIDLRLSNQ
mgnify:CR=1 FL=1